MNKTFVREHRSSSFGSSRVVTLMWHTPVGDRVICGAEAELVQASIRSLVEDIHLHEWDPSEIGFYADIELFDELTWTHKLSAIEQVARYLLTDTSEVLSLSAINEAVIGAIFENVRQLVEQEIAATTCLPPQFSEEHDDDEVNGWYWRDLVLAATIESTSPEDLLDLQAEGMELPAVTSSDYDAWSGLIESLADQILWDRDYELADAFMDDDPDISTAEKKMFGISQDYFTDLPPDPRDDQVQTIVGNIVRLVKAKPR